MPMSIASAGASVRVMSPEEIAARGAGDTPYFQWPQRASLFAERAMRLRQLARGHAMGDFLDFAADIAQAQQARLAVMPSMPLPDADALDRAAREGRPPLSAADWPRDPAWHDVLRALVADLQRSAPAGAQPALARLADADSATLERQADALLLGLLPGTGDGLDLAGAPIIAAALQVLWTHLVLEVQRSWTERGTGGAGQPFGRTDEPGLCPCCGSRPVTSLTRTAGDLMGQRYLHCSLCSMQWHLVRIQCAHCGSGKHIAYQSLDAADADGDEGSARAAQAAVQAETCEDCGHYLKILHSERDPFVEPVADDLASLTLDLLLAETGLQRHGVNLLLLFGGAEASPPEPPPPDPGGA
jgi:FdhE protein